MAGVLGLRSLSGGQAVSPLGSVGRQSSLYPPHRSLPVSSAKAVCFAAVVAPDIFISLTEPQTNTHKQAAMGDVVCLWPRAEVTDLVGPSRHGGRLEPHCSPAQCSDAMDAAGSQTEQPGRVTHKWVRYRFCEREPPLSSGSCRSLRLLPACLCIQVFWEYAPIPSMGRNVCCGLFPISRSHLPSNTHLLSIQKPLRGCILLYDVFTASQSWMSAENRKRYRERCGKGVVVTVG